MRTPVQSFSAPVAVRMMESYLNAGSEIYKKYDKGNVNKDNATDVLCDLIVSNTNIAFACEIGMKLLRYSETKNPNFNGHNLKELFDALSINSQTIIRNFTIMRYNAAIINQPDFTESDFNQTLEEYKDAFVSGRYWYEEFPGAKRAMGNLFMLSFGESIRQYIGMFPFKEKMVWIANP